VKNPQTNTTHIITVKEKPNTFGLLLLPTFRAIRGFYYINPHIRKWKKQLWH